ncbi:MAG: methionine--tRNA ligase subunit beta, partial [Promethearchaeia archaeon]
YLRYYMVSHSSQTKDLDFAWDAFQEKVNSELVNTFGNFVYRALHFSHDNFKAIPEGEIEASVESAIESTVESVVDATNRYELKQVVDEVLRLASFGNEYFQSNKPWELVREDKEKCAEVLYNACCIVKALAGLIEPIMPFVAEEIWEQLGLECEDIHEVDVWEAIKPAQAGREIPQPCPVISKVDDTLIKELHSIIDRRIKDAEAAEMGQEELVSFEDFKKMDFRVGEILECERVPDTDNLLKIIVDIGDEERQIVTGLAQLYECDELVGEKALFLVNLEPKKLAGVESQGMIIAVEHADKEGQWVPLTVEDLPPGSKAA